ncbi:MAG: hypothetical protein Q6353_002265 [Candidatus Sigynarchaeum springense]
MKPVKRPASLMALISLVLLFLPQSCGAVVLSGIVTYPEPNWYKISVESASNLHIEVTAANITANSTLWVVLATGISQNIGLTPTLALDVINKTQNATISYNYNDTRPLYLMILYFYRHLNSSNSIVYSVICSHPIMPYSYSQYYNDVIYPEIIKQVVVVGIILGGIALAITIYLIKRRRKEPHSRLI